MSRYKNLESDMCFTLFSRILISVLFPNINKACASNYLNTYIKLYIFFLRSTSSTYINNFQSE